MKLSRRQFIRNVSITGGALSIGFTLSGCSSDELPGFDKNTFNPNAFLRIAEDGKIVVQIHKAEMGQGVITGIITLIAEELEVDPTNVEYEFAPVHSAYADPEFRLQITGGSASIRVYYDILREAGASARVTLVRAASQESGIPEAELFAENARIRSRDNKYSASYGELVATARHIEVPDNVSLKSPEQFRLIGHFDRRLDAAGKVDGSAVFGIDIEPENTLIAVLVRCPHFGGTLDQWSAEKALQHPGVVDIFQVEQSVAVIAEGYWPALKASEKLEVSFSPAENSLLSTNDIQQAMADAFESEEFITVREEGELPPEGSGTLVEATYGVPLLAHATMEPQNATAFVTQDSCEVWVGSQSPDIARDLAARILQRPRESVVVHNQLMGGGFGRRANADNVAEAVAIAARLKRPVKVIWTREDDTRHDFYRPITAGRLSAKVGADGSVARWQHRIVGPSISQQVFPVMGKTMLPTWAPTGILSMAANWVAKDDASSVEGAKELPYQFDSIKVAYHNFQIPVPLGFWRSVGHSHSAFIVESFVDELAHTAGIDPLAFRQQHLPEDSRQRRVLDAVAELSSWGKPPQGRFHGIAVHESFGTVVAEVAEISLSGGKLKIEKFYCAVECGQVVNPDIVRDQMESGIAFALTAALYGEITLENGAVKEGNFNDYPILRHNEMPGVDVVIINSTAAPSGVGEPGTPPAAPALANAIFAASGKRLRQLPLSIS